MNQKNLKVLADKFVKDLLDKDGRITRKKTLSEVLVDFVEHAKEIQEQEGKPYFVNPLSSTCLLTFPDGTRAFHCPNCSELSLKMHVEQCPKCLASITWEPHE